MTHRNKYYLSIGLFILAFLFMMNAVNDSITAARASAFTGWIVARFFLGFVLVVAAIVWFVICRAHRDQSNINLEQRLPDTEQEQLKHDEHK